MAGQSGLFSRRLRSMTTSSHWETTRHRPRRSTLTSQNSDSLFSTDIPNPTRLRLARKRRGLTQTAMAAKIGVIRRAVVAHEAGDYPPSMETLAKIAAVTRFPMEFFYGDDLDLPSLDT